MDISTIIISLAIAVTGGIVVGKYLFSSNRVSKLEAEKAAIEAGRSELKSRNSQLEKQVLELRNTVAELQEKNLEYKDKDIILSDYTFDTSFGFWRHNSNPKNILCEPCVKKNLPIQGQVIPFGSTEFKCKVCKEHYRNELI